MNAGSFLKGRRRFLQSTLQGDCVPARGAESTNVPSVDVYRGLAGGCVLYCRPALSIREGGLAVTSGQSDCYFFALVEPATCALDDDCAREHFCPPRNRSCLSPFWARKGTTVPTFFLLYLSKIRQKGGGHDCSMVTTYYTTFWGFCQPVCLRHLTNGGGV